MRSEPDFTVRDEDDGMSPTDEATAYYAWAFIGEYGDPLDHPEETHDS